MRTEIEYIKHLNIASFKDRKGHTYKNELVDDKSAIIVPFFLYMICFSESLFIAEDAIALGNPFVPLLICMNIICLEIFLKFIVISRELFSLKQISLFIYRVLTALYPRLDERLIRPRLALDIAVFDPNMTSF